MATYQFTNAYRVNTATTPAGKEANSHDFVFTSLGGVQINDSTGSASFSGNDVSAIGVVIGVATYYGWISRPIKVGGQVKGFYFWTDNNFTSLALAQEDGNQDGDSNVADNLGFILVVDQSYFNGLGLTAGAIGNVGSSSDRVDTALNSLIPTNVAPVGVADTVTAVEAGGASNATAGTNPTGNVTTNDTDANSGDTKTVTKVGTTTAGTSVAASSTSSSNATSVTGTYGTLAIGADGSYSYTVDNSNTTVEGLRTTSNTLTDTFTYTVADSRGLTSTTTLVVTIQGKNDNPTAVNDYNTAKESIAGSGNYTSTDTTGQLATGNVLTNDTDKDSTANGETKTITGFTESVSGTVNTSSTSSASTTLNFSSSNGISSVKSGDHVYYQFAANDFRLLYASDGTTSIFTTSNFNTTTNTISLNSTPAYYYTSTGLAAVAVSTYTVGFDTTTATTTSGNNVKTSTVQSTTSAGTTSVNFTSLSSAIAVGMDVSGSANLQSGTKVASVSYAADGSVSSITLDKDPTASLAGASLTFSTTKSAGTAMTGSYGTLLLNSDGTYTYTPTINNSAIGQGQTVTETFAYTMQDASGATSSANLVITVRGSGTTDPNAVSDTATAVEAGGTSNGTAGTNPTASLLTNDTVGGGAGTLTVVSARAASGSTDTAATAGGVNIAGLYGTLNVKTDGTYTYTVNNSNATVNALASSASTLTDTFVYTMQNTSTGNPQDTATLTVTIQGANDAPVAVNDVALAAEAGGLANATAGYNPTGNVLTNDTDVDTGATQTVSAVRTGSDEGLGTPGTVGSALTGTYGSLTLNSNGTYTYTVDNSSATVNGLAAGATLTDTFNYTVTDGSLTDIATLTVTITGATDTLTVNDVYVNEASAFANFTVTGTAGMPVTLGLANTVASGLASTDRVATLGTDLSNQIQYFVTGIGWTDYTSGSVLLPTGGVMYVRVAITNDTVHEGNESFTLTATTTSSDVTSDYGVGTMGDEGSGDVFLSTNNTGTADGSGTNDDRPTISITSPTVTEGGTPQFTVSLSNTSTQTISFRPTVTSGSATVGTDTAAASALQVSTDGTNWSTVSGAVTIAAGASSVQLKIATSDDASVEGTETFTVGTGYINGTVTNLTGVTGTATITDNDSAATLAVDSVTVNEGTGNATFTVTRSGSTTGAASVQWATSNGTASSGADYTTSSGTLNFADGDATKSFTVPIANDAVYEGSETFTVTLSNASGATIGTATGTGTLKDDGTGTGGTDNDTPTLSIADVSVAEGGEAIFTVALSKTSTGAVSFTPSLSSGTATLGSDTAAASTLQVSTDGTNWSTVSGAVTIAAGASSVRLKIATSDDALAESSEAFTLSTGAITGTVTNTGAVSATATITDNDTAGITLSQSALTTSEAGTTASFTVRLNSQPANNVVVTLTGLDATEGSLSTTTLTFTSANWNTAQTVTVTGADDALVDGSIAYTLTATTSGDAAYHGANSKTGTVTVTNTDNDTAPSLAVNSVTVNEAAGTATFTVTRSGATGATASVDWAASNGTATAGSDYTGSSGNTLNFGVGDATKTFTVAIANDTVYEGSETFTVTLSNATGATIGTATGTGTIKDDGTGTGGTDNDTPTLSIADVSVAEGGEAIFTVALSKTSTGAVSFTPSLSSGTATLGSDTAAAGTLQVSTDGGANWSAVSGAVTIAAGASSVKLKIVTTDDALAESSEAFTLSTGAITGTVTNTGAVTATATMTDNDTAALTLGAVVGNTTEAGGTATFTVKLTSQPTADVVVTVASGDTTEGTALPATLTFTGANWNTTQTVTVSGVDDAIDDGDIAYSVTLTAASSDTTYDGKSATASVTNTDNDAPPTLAIGSVSVAEGAGTASFTVTRSGATGGVTTVDWATGGGTATAGSDYTAGSGTLSFAAGETSKTITVAITDDVLSEGSETFNVTLSNVADATSAAESIGTATGVATITDNDTAGFTVSAVTGNTTEAGGQASFTVRLNSQPTADVTVTVASSNTGEGTAATTLTFTSANWNTAQTVTVTGQDDAIDDGDIAYNVTLAAASADGNYNGASASVAVTNQDNDAPPVVAIGNVTLAESAGSASFTVTRSGAVGGATTVQWATGGGSATAGADYTAGSGTLSFAAGETSKTITVAVSEDTLSEGSETFNVTLSNVADATSAAESIGTATGVATITDNDTAPSLAVNSVTVNEAAGTATFTVTRSGATGATASVDWATSNGTATAGADYTAGNGTVSFAIGETSKTFTVAIANDTVYEGSETFTVTLSNASGATIGTATGTGTLKDDGTGTGGTDNDTPTVSIADVSVAEGGAAIFTVALSKTSTGAVSFTPSLSSGTATLGTDTAAASTLQVSSDGGGTWSTVSGAVTIAAGASSVKLKIATTDDALAESSEAFTLSTGAITGTVTNAGAATGTATITDNDIVSVASVTAEDAATAGGSGDSSVVEGNSLRYAVVLNQATIAATQFTLAASGSAAGADYSASYVFSDGVTYSSSTGKITVPTGVSGFTMTVSTGDDAAVENAETLVMTIGGVAGTGTITDNDAPEISPPAPPPPPPPGGGSGGGTPPPVLSADLDPATDNGPSNTDRVTSIIEPEFTVTAGNLLVAGQTVQLVAPGGGIVGTSQVTAQDVTAGAVNVPSVPLDDGTYVFTAQILDAAGALVGEGPVTVTIITDRDGVQPSIELAANGGDFNRDGVFDWEQNNVAQMPLGSLADFLAGRDASEASFGAIMAGTIDFSNPGGAVRLDATAQLLNLSLAELPAPLPESVQQATPVLNFSVTSQDGTSLQDLDASRPGLQTRVVIDLPAGVLANTFGKWNQVTASWFEFLDDGELSTLDDGATLLDLDHDGKVDRVVVTLTDGGPGDEDGQANGIVVDPGVLAFVPRASAAKPVYSVLLASGDRFYSTDAAEAAQAAEGTANVFEGVRFDSLDAAAGGRQLFANYNPFTTDWYFAAEGDPMPYFCYQRMPGAGFQAAASSQGPGTDFHLFMNSRGITQLVTLNEATDLGLASQGFFDHGSIFNTTTLSAFRFDAEGYLVANQANEGVQSLVQALAATYRSTSDTGFVEAVEQHYLGQVKLVGVPHGSDASATDVNAAFGTGFSG